MAYNHTEYMRKYREEKRRTKGFRAGQLEQSTTIGAPLPQPAVDVPISNAPAHGLTIAVIPDAQVKPGVPINHLTAAGKYIADKRPDIVLCIGDFADMASLSTYDKPGSAKKENKRYRADIDASKRGMDALMTPIRQARGYKPSLILTLGNHEDRIHRTLSNDPTFEGAIGMADLAYESYGWNVVPFLQPVILGGVVFCHYFPGGVMGRPIQTPGMILSKLHMSAFAGHQQGRQIAYARRADGQELTAIISGSFYQHDEEYMSPLGNKHWRGMWFLHEVQDGHFDEMALSINYLLRKWL